LIKKKMNSNFAEIERFKKELALSRQGVVDSELLLQQTRRNYETLFNSTKEFHFVTDKAGNILFANSTARERLNYNETELNSMTFGNIHPESGRNEAVRILQSIPDGSETICKIPLKTRDGIEIPVETRLTHGVWNGQSSVFAVCTDVTQQRTAEHILQVSEKKYRTILNASPDGMILIDLDGVITEISELGLELLGAQKRDEMIGLDFARFVPKENESVIIEMIEKTISDGLTQNMEVIIKKKNQSLFPGELSSTLIQGPDGSPLSFMILLRDITQRKKAEAKQLHADRMANLGEMASGIAHEINQPLNIISMIFDKILFDSARSNRVDIDFIKEKSDRIFENITRIRNIIDHIRAFSRSHDDYVLSTFNINLAIENAVSMITEQFKYLGITLNLNLERELPEICGNTFKFEQVIVNLLVNAKDAILEKKNAAKEYADPEICITTWHDFNSITVTVTDNGIGIKEEDINNVILPFYTTKAEGKGTGLGLSICYQIIKEMSGTIDIISSRSTGTEIEITIDIRNHKNN
jgi:PAS domain S-box-containing protein